MNNGEVSRKKVKDTETNMAVTLATSDYENDKRSDNVNQVHQIYDRISTSSNNSVCDLCTLHDMMLSVD